MSIDKRLFTQLIRDFNFKGLFNELGWENVVKEESIILGSETYKLEAAAEKRGFVIFVCSPDSRGKMPDYSVRKKIDKAVTNLYFEHIIIYTNQSRNQQIWQLVIREQGKPAIVRETPFYSHQEPELLFQRLRGLFFSIDDEERISIVDVKSRIHEQFNTNAEKVTRQFYDKFKKEHNAFLEFIKGINDIANKEWYASLMLNRLMFIYFIQKKGFLDNNKNYLRDKLNATKEKKGKNKFHSFYKHFLLVLFHKGLGSPERTDSLVQDIGNIPYLNGGLFDVHRIEDDYSNIKIEDKAFEQIFNFFDQYEWHLDTRITASGRDINPDVIGYIFEKYINDRAAMGAYYTKEDITEYISKNCIIPYIFDEVKRNYPGAIKLDSKIWLLLKEDPDRYIYDAVKYGVKNVLPPEIECGIKEVSKRTEWNRPATSEYALPTEIWREVVERRKRYFDIISKIEKDEITEINDFITYNLNIRQFAQDIIENTGDPDLIRHLYKALSSITVLDPTCGSGAFLFAALNILEPLYEACIMRMENFVSEAKKGKYKFFEQTLGQINSPSHPNLQYFIFKSIILNNLYGVDIMNEAVEIAKLRLFLKLMAAVDTDYKKPNMGLEPLPDVDFNIRAGNTLIGFATLEELQSSIQSALDFDNNAEKFREKAEIVSAAYKRFKDEQLTSDKGEQS